VFDAIRSVKDSSFTGGIRNFGLREQGVGYVYDEYNAALIPQQVHARVEQLRDSIVAGYITVPSAR